MGQSLDENLGLCLQAHSLYAAGLCLRGLGLSGLFNFLRALRQKLVGDLLDSETWGCLAQSACHPDGSHLNPTGLGGRECVL